MTMPADKMTDTEIVRKCAVAMGWHTGRQAKKVVAYDVSDCAIIAGNDRGGESVYDPLHDRAQAMDLVIKFRLFIDPPDWQPIEDWNTWQVNHYDGGEVTEIRSEDLLRAICECVANIKGTT